jgi:hypothetical protein
MKIERATLRAFFAKEVRDFDFLAKFQESESTQRVGESLWRFSTEWVKSRDIRTRLRLIWE